ncbi:peptidyl-prolyl cis-trans isomerase D [Roseiarcus fermentans]|uniref:Parvulin-like PPIase n=1 Tax=Roseiarcus fermentans TaxID=1473586 RepID=A0A366ENP6_9HYPH|nr:peptidylprolyl isomerase [Roseiarcus fermentans]RBP03095.1 peptidyl-prolyl cis-trans isomerase D [Roseiarcus fermentans]
MLESMRNAAQGVVGKAIMTVVMGLIIVSFVIWGVGDMLRGFSASNVASVGPARISAQDYRYEYQRTLQQYQRRLRQPFTNEQARAIGLDRQVLQRMISEAAIDAETSKLGLDVSDDALRAMIVGNPDFQDKSGAFDPQKFAGLLRDNDLNERFYVAEMKKNALRQFILAALASGLTAPKAMASAEAAYDGQTRSADTFVLPASAAGDIPAPSDDTLKAYYNDRKSSYRAPEYRSFDAVALEPETLADAGEVSDADAKAAYARVAGKDPKYGAPEKRDLDQILFPSQAEAAEADAKIKAGASFDDIVKARNLKPDDIALGPTARDAIIDPAEAEAVFALPAGGVSGVLSSQFGPVIVRVKSITPSTVKPFAEVADDVKRQISAGRAGDKIQALHDKIEDLRVSGKPLAEAARDEGLKTISVAAVDASGKDPSGAEVALPARAELLKAVFASDVGLDEAPLPTRDRGFVWFAVSKVEPSHERSFAEAKPQVEAQWRAEQVDKALASKADDLVKDLRSGASVADVAKSVGAPVRSVTDIRRGDKASLPESVVAAIFREPADGVGSAAVPGGRAVFKITADKTPPVAAIDPAVKATAQQLDEAVRESVIDQYIASLRRSLGVTVNQTVLQSAEGG